MGQAETRRKARASQRKDTQDLYAHAIAKVVAEEVDVNALEKIQLLIDSAPLDMNAVVLLLLHHVLGVRENTSEPMCMRA